MRFKQLVERLMLVAKRESVTKEEALWVDRLLGNVDAGLSNQEQQTLAQFFWGTTETPIWMSLLRHRIVECPSVVITDTGYQIPVWLAEPYMRTQIKRKEDSALMLLLEITTNNARFYDVAAEAALVFDRDKAKSLLPLLIEFANNSFTFTKRMLPRVLSRFAADGLTQEALVLADHIVRFGPDPAEAEKTARRKIDPEDWGTNPEPRPKLEQWEYQEVLEKGIKPLAKVAPLETSQLLISATTEMLGLKSASEEEPWSDTSEIWAPRIGEPTRHHMDSKAALIRVLVYACEQVYEQAPTLIPIASLDRLLRNAKWLVFTRVRYHLYAQHPARTKEWIHAAIVGYPHYERWKYHFELQKLIRVACEHFGHTLLTQDELTAIFDRIFSGPDREDFKAFMGERYSDEGFTARQKRFQLAQLRPFASVLFGEYKQLYDSLAEHQQPPTDEEYAPYSVGETKTGGSRSPKSADELASMGDDELIGFINDWDDVHRDPKQWWIDVDFEGLGIALKQVIERDPGRFVNWGTRWQRITRPIYFSYALQAASDRIKAGTMSELDRWLQLADWIVHRQVVPTEDGSTEDAQSWNSARRAVVDLIEICLKAETNVPLEWREQLFSLINSICSGFDPFLDAGQPIITPRDYLTDAINTTRGRGMQCLIEYGFWVRRSEPETNTPEIFEILDARLGEHPPLTKPEYALLGSDFNRLYFLNAPAAERCVSRLFPLTVPEIWRISFANYVTWDRPYNLLFGLLRRHFAFALDNVAVWLETKDSRQDPVGHLGEHLFAHYVWSNDELESETSLLRRFYDVTPEAEWAKLFDHVGRSLKDSHDISESLKQRCKEFFEFRLAARNATELSEFTFWLEAECLEAGWRLRAFLKALEVMSARAAHKEILVENLANLLNNEPDLVVQCFSRLSEAAVGAEYFHVQSEKVRPILETGLASTNPVTREAAMAAQDNLLRGGHSEYLNIP